VKRLIFACLLLSPVLCPAIGAADSPTTQTAPASTQPISWDDCVAIFSSVDSVAKLAPLLADGCVIHRFGNDPDTDAAPLIKFVAAQSPVGQHAYPMPSERIAADIADDVSRSALIPDSIKHFMTPDSPDARRSAAAVAIRWIELSVDADDATPVGVIILWNSTGGENSQGRALFVLLKGQQTPSGFKITAIAYGDPLQT